MTNEFLDIFLDELFDTIEIWDENVAKVPYDSAEALNALFRCAHNLKGSSKSVGLTTVAHFIHDVEDYVTALRDNFVPITETAIGFLKTVSQELADWEKILRLDPTAQKDTQALSSWVDESLKGVAGYNSKRAKPVETKETPQAEKTETLAAALQSAQEGEIIWDFNYQHEKTLPEAESKPQGQMAKIPSSPVPAKNPPENFKSAERSETKETVRVTRQVIDQAISALGELSFKVDTLRSCGELSIEAAAEIKPQIAQVYESLLGIILTPVESLFRYLDSVIADVAGKTNKNVDVKISGQDTLLDKKTLERIKDPLMHIVRNAVDHGIEEPKARQALGKNPKGQVSLSARKNPTGVWIEIQDDGKGMDPEKLRAKAIEKNLISPETTLTSKECYQLILLPGFSTAAAITEFSGRGVGMDVVKSAIEGVQGRLEIDSQHGNGSLFRLFLPSRASLLETLLIEHEGSKYAIATEGVQEVLFVDSADIQHHEMFGPRLMYQEHSVPITSLSVLLNNSKQKLAEPAYPAATAVYLLLVQSGKSLCALQIDRVCALQKQMVQPVPQHLTNIPCAVGTTRLPDGMPAFVLDISERINQQVQHAS